jgi:transcriptional regulator with XRE-family HTH domain
MNLRELADKKGLSGYALSHLSGIPQTTITDLLSGQANLLKCNAETLFRLSQSLGLSVDELIMEDFISQHSSVAFDVFRNNVSHRLKSFGDQKYLTALYKSGDVLRFYEAGVYPKAFYLVALADYLSRLHGWPLAREFDLLRQKKLKEALYPTGVLLKVQVGQSTLSGIEKAAIPEFRRFNIMEGTVRDAV